MEHTTTRPPGLPVPTRERHEDRSQEDRPGDVPENGSPEFDAIVAALRSSDRTARLRRNTASPQQMFEARNHNAHDARMQALEAHDRDNRLSGQGTRETEPTGIAARRAARTTDSTGHLVGDDRLKRGVVEAVVGLGEALVVADHEVGAELIERATSSFYVRDRLPRCW